jgi:hypothetical protein
VGKLISGCSPIEIIPTTFKYVTAYPHSPHLPPSFLLPSSPLTTPRPSRPPSVSRHLTMDSSQSQRSTPEIPTKYDVSVFVLSYLPTGVSTGSRQLSGVPGHAPSVAQPRSIHYCFENRSDLTVV